jgi:RNA recognition motif-containing protein
MPSRLFVGNLPYDATEVELKAHFAQAGPVSRVFIPLDRETGRVRGFAFIEFPDPAHAAQAIQQLHQQPFKDRPLVVNEARPSEARGPGAGPRPAGPRPAGRPPSGPPRPFRPEARERTTVGGSDRPAARKASPSRPRRRGKRSPWDDGPKKEPLKEKIGGRFFGGDDDADEEEAEDAEFDDFATGLPDSDEES